MMARPILPRRSKVCAAITKYRITEAVTVTFLQSKTYEIVR
jgi:hypothetical protein